MRRAASTNKPAYAKLFSSGRSPVSAGAYDPNRVGGTNGNSLSKVFDGDASTVWKSGTYASGVGSGVGFYVDDGAPGSIKGLGLLTKTPGFDVQVYAYDGDTLSYKYDVTNKGDGDLTDVSLTDTVDGHAGCTAISGPSGDNGDKATATVAERSGYRCEGVLRSKHFKDGLRADLGVWSRLRSDGHLT